ncbi:MAG: ATP-binding protein [Gammaproteobacteria bacterium]|nr:ATP-binding protein [Gammaproteobacteria bacterium]
MADSDHRFSFEGKLTLLIVAAATVMAAFAVGAFALTGSPWLALLFSLAIVLPLCIWAVRVFMAPVNRLFQALIGGVASLRDNDFSISIADVRNDELGDLVRVYNELGTILRDERQNLFQRELLLDTVIQSTPLALVLTNSNGAIVYSNSSARHLFLDGRRLEGRSFSALLDNVPPPMRDAAQRRQDGLFTVDTGAEPETWHLSQREFVLNAQPHQLYLFKRLTREINRQEVATWKKVIRVIGHELNNSLAPISSLAHSGSVIIDQPDRARLSSIFSTIEERANHLKAFIDGYARFAKLPQPQPGFVDWSALVESLRRTAPFVLQEPLPAQPGYFDSVQIEQVLINLLKNARESGSDEDEITIDVAVDGAAQTIRVLDRGAGMSEKVLASALLPFYSTKKSGSGLGLPLSREIIEAHGGRLSLANRKNGGMLVEIALPCATPASENGRRRAS